MLWKWNHPRPAALALGSSVLLGGASAATPATPPPFVLPPPAPVRPAAPGDNVPFALRAAMEKSHALWRRFDGGARYYSSLTYLRGRPSLMLFTAQGEAGADTLHRKRAIVQACGFLLDDSAFDRALICVVEVDGHRRNRPRLRNYQLHRGAFQAAAKFATGSSDHKDAVNKARDNDNHSLRICADLGID